MEKQIKDYGDRISSQDRQNIEGAIEALRDAIKSDNIDRIKKAEEDLKQASYKMAESLYSAGGSGPAGGYGPPPGAGYGPPPGGVAPPGGDNVVDAEFRAN